MKKLKLTLALAATMLATPALSGCAGLAQLISGVPASPSAASNQTILDEKAADLAELSYQLVVTLGETGIDAGVINSSNAACVAQLDKKAYAGLVSIRSAYRTSNAQSYNLAVKEFGSSLADFRGAVKGATDKC